MMAKNSFLRSLLANISKIRKRANFTETQLEEQLILGPGWINRFECGDTIPSIDMLLAIIKETNSSIPDLLDGLPPLGASPVERSIFAEEDCGDLIIHFTYADHDATFRLKRATLGQYELVIKALRDGLSRLVSSESQAIKTDSVAMAFLKAVEVWPHANPSDIWWFIIYRAYCDPYNHPAQFARLNFDQSWKRTGGWALEEILVRYYGSFLKQNGINILIADAPTKRELVAKLSFSDRIEADKIDVVLTGDTRRGTRFFGVVHVKASFAERRTDDVPMSNALSKAGYTSPLWTMDCKSMPGPNPVNKGELGDIDSNRSAKRKDIEDEGYFTGCFSYNQNTLPSNSGHPELRRVYVCDFRSPDDAFSRFLIKRWRAFQLT